LPHKLRNFWKFGITLAVDNNGCSSVVVGWTTLGVNMDASSYLYTIATLSMTFAGLSVLTMILRQMLGGQITKFDSFVTRTWIQLGFMTAFASILLPLLVLCETPTTMAWRASSGAMAVILGWWALAFPRRRGAATKTPLPRHVVVFCVAMDVTALAFAANATILPQERLPGIYAGGATAILIGAGMLFLSTHVRWYEALPEPEQKAKS
jgi:hypothetical protein